MDVVLDLADKHVFDDLYASLRHTIVPFGARTLQAAATGLGFNWKHLISPSSSLPPLTVASPLSSTAAASDFSLLTNFLSEHLQRDAIFRQFLSLFLLTLTFAFVLYFLSASLSYFCFFDRTLERHPRFLKNQIRKEIALSISGFPLTTLVTVPWFVGEVRGYSRLYGGGWGAEKDDSAEGYSWAYAAFSAVWFLVFTDGCIYWIHRWLHHPQVYWWLHKPHHKWIVPTPFASHAFHPLDGYSQSLPYHLFVYLFPMNKFLYLALFSFVNLWTVGIHSGYFPTIPFINGPGHHTVHHMDFNYNYGQYLTWMDKLGGTFREPRDEAITVKQRAKKL